VTTIVYKCLGCGKLAESALCQHCNADMAIELVLMAEASDSEKMTGVIQESLAFDIKR